MHSSSRSCDVYVGGRLEAATAELEGCREREPRLTDEAQQAKAGLELVKGELEDAGETKEERRRQFVWRRENEGGEGELCRGESLGVYIRCGGG